MLRVVLGLSLVLSALAADSCQISSSKYEDLPTVDLDVGINKFKNAYPDLKNETLEILLDEYRNVAKCQGLCGDERLECWKNFSEKGFEYENHLTMFSERGMKEIVRGICLCGYQNNEDHELFKKGELEKELNILYHIRENGCCKKETFSSDEKFGACAYAVKKGTETGRLKKYCDAMFSRRCSEERITPNRYKAIEEHRKKLKHSCMKKCYQPESEGCHKGARGTRPGRPRKGKKSGNRRPRAAGLLTKNHKHRTAGRNRPGKPKQMNSVYTLGGQSVNKTIESICKSEINSCLKQYILPLHGLTEQEYNAIIAKCCDKNLKGFDEQEDCFYNSALYYRLTFFTGISGGLITSDTKRDLLCVTNSTKRFAPENAGFEDLKDFPLFRPTWTGSLEVSDTIWFLKHIETQAIKDKALEGCEDGIKLAKSHPAPVGIFLGATAQSLTANIEMHSIAYMVGFKTCGVKAAMEQLRFLKQATSDDADQCPKFE